MKSFFTWLGRITGSGIYAAVLVVAAGLIVAAIVLSSSILGLAEGRGVSNQSGPWLQRYAAFLDQRIIRPFKRDSVTLQQQVDDVSPAGAARQARPDDVSAEPKLKNAATRKFGRPLLAKAGRATRRAPEAGSQILAGLPLIFSESCGVDQKPFDFEARGAGFSVHFREREAVIEVSHAVKPSDSENAETLASRKETVRMVFAGSSDVPPKALGRSAGEYHYLLGLRSGQWVTHAPAFPAIIYEDLYPDTDLVFYGTRERLEYVFLLGPDADPDAIALKFPSNTVLPTRENNVLHLPMSCGEIMQNQPLVFHTQGQETSRVIMQFLADKETTRVAEVPGGKAASSTLSGTIDLASYLGGNGSEQIFDLVFDGKGNIFVIGETTSPNFSADPERVPGDSDNVAAFVTKVRLADSMHMFTTFIGGRSQDRALAGAVDADGQLHICGETRSSDFPVDTRYNTSSANSAWDGWVAQVDPDGSGFTHLRRLGGRNDDRCFDLAVGDDGTIWVAGETESDIIDGTPLATDARATLGGYDAFAVRLQNGDYAEASGLRFGGTDDDQALGIAVSSSNAVYVVGQTTSVNFPSSALGNPTYQGQGDAYVTKILADDDGLRITDRFRFGGRNTDVATAVAVSAAGTVAVVGRTASADMTALNAVQEVHGGGKWDGFLATLSGTEVLSFSYFGGSGMDLIHAVDIDPSGNVVIAGASNSTNLPAGGTVQSQHAGGVWDGFVARFVGRLPSLDWCTYIGGTSADQLYTVKFDGGRNIVVGGATSSTEMPMPNALQQVYNGGGLDALFMRFPMGPSPHELMLVRGGGQPMGPAYDYFMGRFEVTCHAYARFLNDAEANVNNVRGANMFFDEDGNVWMSPERHQNRHELFTLWDSHLVYRVEKPVGDRYGVSDLVPARGMRFDAHPITGVSWFGALKYCNWLTIEAGRSISQRCYTEGREPSGWRPVTARRWQSGRFDVPEREAWLAKKGFRLPMDGAHGLISNAGPYNEFYKAASWTGGSNSVFGFGRNSFKPGDANYLDHGVVRVTETTPVGYFDVPGGSTLGEGHGNQNRYGIADLSGNVSEWLSDLGGTNAPMSRASYGGSYMYTLPRISDRFFVHPHFTDPFRGFRLASTFREPTLTAVRVPMRICVCE